MKEEQESNKSDENNELLINDKHRKSLRFNSCKVQWSLIHYKSIESLPKVLEFGSIKYSRDNWKIGLDLNEIIDSMSRHLHALIDGEVNDPESGLPHVGHIMCNCMFWSYHYNNK